MIPCMVKSWSYCSGVSRCLVRLRELEPKDQRLDAADDQEHEGGHDVADADLLVIDGREPADQSGLGLPQPIEPRRQRGVIARGEFRERGNIA